jgi:Bacterial Ig-like domain (group 2)
VLAWSPASVADSAIIGPPQEALVRHLRLPAAIVAAMLSAGACGHQTPASPSPGPAQTLTARSLTLSGQTLFTATGQANQLAAVVTFSDGSVRDVTSECLWQTEGADMVRVSATGLVTALAYGTTSVWATYRTVSATAFEIVRAAGVGTQVPTNVQALTGAWRNARLSGGITRIEFRIDRDRIVARAWGSCLPTDCDWGEVSTPVADGDDGVLSLAWNFGYATVSQEIRLLLDGRLESWLHEHYTDQSGRTDHDAAEYFIK